MGELEDIKTLLEANLSSINSTLQLHQQLILNLQRENQNLKELIIGMNDKKKDKDPLKVEVINKFKRNKKRMIKNKILETVKYNQLSIPEIKEKIVDQYNFCSKATFYRYIEELKKHDFIHINSLNMVKIKPLVEVV